ncbi:MAG: ABC transporter ATP-binding protein [Bacillota bacterium]
MPVLYAKHIVKIYAARKGAVPTKALAGVDISVETGEFVGVMGPSGSGKTTLMNILSGIDRPMSGNVGIDGVEIARMTPDELALFRRRKMGFVFQDFNLMDSLTLKENIMLPMILDRKKAGEMESKAGEIMRMLDIADIADKYPYEVSGGQQQRCAVGRALVNSPAVVFADEPTGNLDSRSSGTVMKYFEKINEEKRATILIVTHDPFAASFCRRIIFLKDGAVSMEILRKGRRKEFFDKILDCLAVLGGGNNDIQPGSI